MSNYKEDLDEIKWSFSTLHMYEECPYSFYMKKILKEPGVPNAYAEIGSFAHEILEGLFSQKIALGGAIDRWNNEFEDNITSWVKEETKDKKFGDFLDYLNAFDESWKDKYEVVGTELKCEWVIQGFKFIGFIDLLLKEKSTGDLMLVDHKSSGHFLKKDGSVLKSQKENFEAYSKQMYLYCYPIFEKFGKFPKNIIWNHFFENKVTCIDFNKDDYDKVIGWSLGVINQIYEDETFEACQSYMRCKVLCDWREDCEYLEEEDE